VITICNTELFNELQESICWDTLFNDDYTAKDLAIPTLAGLDHISSNEDEVIFWDRGCNKSGGWASDNTFRVIKEL